MLCPVLLQPYRPADNVASGVPRYSDVVLHKRHRQHKTPFCFGARTHSCVCLVKSMAIFPVQNY